MTGNSKLFLSLAKYDGGKVTFGDNGKGKVCGIGTIGNKKFQLKDVLLVKGLKHNLLSISQLCDNGYDVHFKLGKNIVELVNVNTNENILVGKRFNNVYTLQIDDLISHDVSCLLARDEEAELWHR